MSDRRAGRFQGQGWYLEDRTYDWLLTRDRQVSKRVKFWGQEIDIAALREDGRQPCRLIGSVKDFFEREKITPCTLWRLIAMAYSARAEPLLVHNHRAELTDAAQAIAEKWRVRIATDRDVLENAPLPDPERPPDGRNFQFPPPINRAASFPHQRAPDYYGKLDPETARERLDIHFYDE